MVAYLGIPFFDVPFVRKIPFSLVFDSNNTSESVSESDRVFARATEMSMKHKLEMFFNRSQFYNSYIEIVLRVGFSCSFVSNREYF